MSLSVTPSSKEGIFIAKWSWTAGALIRREVAQTVRNVAWETDVNLDMLEDKRWFESRFFCTVEGTKANLTKFFSVIDPLKRKCRNVDSYSDSCG